MGVRLHFPVAALDAEGMAALQGITTSGVVATDGSSLPATHAKEEDPLRPTTHMDLEP